MAFPRITQRNPSLTPTASLSYYPAQLLPPPNTSSVQSRTLQDNGGQQTPWQTSAGPHRSVNAGAHRSAGHRAAHPGPAPEVAPKRRRQPSALKSNLGQGGEKQRGPQRIYGARPGLGVSAALGKPPGPRPRPSLGEHAQAPGNSRSRGGRRARACSTGKA